MTSIYLGLGGNLKSPGKMIRKALKAVACIPGVTLLKVSRFYQTSPVGDINQSDFINAVCHLSTVLDPKILMWELQKIEMDLGKVPKGKTAPRIIDIDLLFYGTLTYLDEELEIPHPLWKKRLFVLVPLAELTSHIKITSGFGCEDFVLNDLIVSLVGSGQDICVYGEA